MEVQGDLQQLPNKELAIIHVKEKPTPLTIKAVEYAGIGAIEVDEQPNIEASYVNMSEIPGTRR